MLLRLLSRHRRRRMVTRRRRRRRSPPCHSLGSHEPHTRIIGKLHEFLSTRLEVVRHGLSSSIHKVDVVDHGGSMRGFSGCHGIAGVSIKVASIGCHEGH